MRKLLLNPTPLFRKLRQLSMLLTLLLALPQTAWGQDTYGITIGRTPITSANKDDVFSDGKVSFTPATDTNPTNTLTLRGASIDGGGTKPFEHGITVTNLANLTIICAGETGSCSNSDVYSTGTPIYCTDASCDLTFTSEENSNNYIQFDANATSLVEGFKTVTYVENKAEQFLPQKQIGFITYKIDFNHSDAGGAPSLNTKTRTFDTTHLNSANHNVLSGGGFTFDPTTCTLTILDGTKFGRLADAQLQQSAIYTEIQWGVDADLRVVINGDCQIIGGQHVNGNITFTYYPFRNFDALTGAVHNGRKISFEKGPNATNANLALVGVGSTKASLFEDFAESDISWTGDLQWVSGLPVENSASISASYDITIETTPVTVAAGKGGITPGSGSGKVYYDGASNIMTLDGVNLNGPIATDINNMIIELKGENKINSDADNAIKRISSNETLNLTIRPADSDPLGSINLANSSSNLVDGFNVSLGGALFAYPALSGSHNSYITSLLVGSQMVAHTGDVFSSNSKVSFDNSSNTNVLTLSGVTDDLKYSKIISGLSNLTINFNDANTIVREDSATAIMSTNSNSVLTFTKATDASSLTISHVPGEHSIIHGFKSITYGDGIYQATSAPATYVNTPDKGLLSALDNTTPISSLSLSSSPSYQLWVAGTQPTSTITSGTGWSYDNDNKKLTLNGGSGGNTITGQIISGLGDLTIDIQGDNTIIVNDTASVIRSTSAGKLTITKTGTTASLQLNNTRQSYYHSPIIKDFASFELAEGLYLSNAKAYGDEEVPAGYEAFTNVSQNGGNSTMGLITPTLLSNGDKGIRNITISTNEYYPIWVAHHRASVGNGYNVVYTQISPTNKDDFLGDVVPRVSFIPASTGNGNVNTLVLNGAAITDAIISNLANLTIEFSGTNSLCENGKTAGYIHSSNPNAIITFKSVADNSSISLECANDYAVVEGFANVAFDKAVAQYSGSFSYNTTEKRYKNNSGALQSLTIKAPTVTDISSCFQGQNNYGTYYNTADNYTIPAGMEAYIVTGVSGNQVVLKSLSILPKQTALLLFKGTATSFNSVTTNETADTSENILMHADVTVTTTGKEYILYKDEFVKATETIPSGKCYLYLTGVAPARGMYGIGNDGSTAIEGIDVEATEDETWYDLQGRRIQKPTKAGIYIVNGKKMIINNK